MVPPMILKLKKFCIYELNIRFINEKKTKQNKKINEMQYFLDFSYLEYTVSGKLE